MNANEHEVRELTLWIDNTEQLVNMRDRIRANMADFMIAGTYQPELAIKGWRHLADAGSQDYKREFGYAFTTAVRAAVAMHYAVEQAEEIARQVAHDYEAIRQAGYDKGYRTDWECRLAGLHHDYIMTDGAAIETRELVESLVTA